MAKVAIKGASYVMVHAPDLLIHNGSTQVGARLNNPDDEYLKAIPKHLRSFDDAVNYPPNQVYIGNLSCDDLGSIPQPWYKDAKTSPKKGAFGEIMSQSEFYILMKHADVFELVCLSQDFTKTATKLIEENPLLKENNIKLGDGMPIADIEKMVASHTAEGLYEKDVLIGCVKQAHATDENLSAHTMLENLATKASGIFAAWCMGKLEGIDMKDVDYILECSEEAAGDVNQRGGGNIAKAVGEKSGCINASGSDVRGFCAAPVHALLHGAALVAAGIFKSVLVVSGGSVPKLGMNGRDHVKKDLPLFEDMIAGFAIMLGEDDGINPVINTSIVGKHNISSGSSPQAVMSVLVYDPLNNAGLKITDIERYSAELQNHEITTPAGAGNVPEANVKMVAALGVMKGQLQKTDIPSFVKEKGIVGFAPTQGHIPSGVPFVGHARRDMLAKKLKNAMIIGKGSLFLGRLTNLFDGLSFVMEANDGKIEGSASKSGSSADENAIRSVVAKAMKAVAESILKE